MAPFVWFLYDDDREANEPVSRTSVLPEPTILPELELGPSSRDRYQEPNTSDQNASILGNLPVVKECEEGLMGVEDAAFSPYMESV